MAVVDLGALVEWSETSAPPCACFLSRASLNFFFMSSLGVGRGLFDSDTGASWIGGAVRRSTLASAAARSSSWRFPGGAGQRPRWRAFQSRIRCG